MLFWEGLLYLLFDVLRDEDPTPIHCFSSRDSHQLPWEKYTLPCAHAVIEPVELAYCLLRNTGMPHAPIVRTVSATKHVKQIHRSMDPT